MKAKDGLNNRERSKNDEDFMTGITIRPAREQDIVWVCNLIKDGARGGHFGFTIEKQAEDLVKEILLRGGVTMMKLRDSIQVPQFCNGAISIAEVDGQPAAFLLTMHDVGEVEIHLAATKKEFRRLGVFTQLIQREIDLNTNTTKKLYARCYKKSSWAIEAFKKQGFVQVSHGEPVELVFSPLA